MHVGCCFYINFMVSYASCNITSFAVFWCRLSVKTVCYILQHTIIVPGIESIDRYVNVKFINRFFLRNIILNIYYLQFHVILFELIFPLFEKRYFKIVAKYIKWKLRSRSSSWVMKSYWDQLFKWTIKVMMRNISWCIKRKWNPDLKKSRCKVKCSV